MITTKYYAGNIALLLVGVVVAVVDGWIAAMTVGFGSDPVHNLRSGAMMAVLASSLMLPPTCLITVRWPGLGANLCWGIAAVCFISIWASPLVILFLIFAVIEGLIAIKIASRSERTPPLRVTPP